MDYAELIKMAFEARKYAYAPYSHFKVGAALCAENGKIYTGCNVENASFGATMCAERTAVFKAVSRGERDFKAIAIVGGLTEEERELSGYAYPCGMCRQVLSEFGKPDMKVIVARTAEDYKEFTLGELLPESFTL
ncbi:MAG: cytidine deaminase [Lachnospiraceae bacterium]|nr:cytidine deaminase [Lachnospiraceae bacterium]